MLAGDEPFDEATMLDEHGELDFPDEDGMRSTEERMPETTRA